jgi:hypothetical protein
MASPARNPSEAEDFLEGEGPYVEQFYPRQMTWYAPEGPQGRIEEMGRWIRENPWKAVAAGVFVGLAASRASGPALRVADRFLSAACARQRVQ